MFILLYSWYEGDSDLIDDTFVAMSANTKSLINIARSIHTDAEIYRGRIPDDGTYADWRHRYRIIEIEPDEIFTDRHGAWITSCDKKLVTHSQTME